MNLAKCPYTWVMGLLAGKRHSKEARHLRVSVVKNDQPVVDVALPARSARWLIDLIPDDVVRKIREEDISLEQIQEELARQQELVPTRIFELNEAHRKVSVWLE